MIVKDRDRHPIDQYLAHDFGGDPLAAARGIVWGVIGSIPVWLLIIGVALMVRRWVR